jgi:hypothetical protein
MAGGHPEKGVSFFMSGRLPYTYEIPIEYVMIF